MSNGFHMSIGVSPNRTDLTHEINLLKAGLLYADKIKLYSISSNYLAMLSYGSKRLSRRDSLSMIKNVMEANGQGDEYKTLMRVYKRLNNLAKKGRLTTNESNELVEINKMFKSVVSEVRKGLGTSVGSFEGVKDLENAIDSGLIEIHIFQNLDNLDNLIHEFFEATKQEILNKRTYPLFDDVTGNLMRSAIREGKIDINRPTSEKSKHVGLSSNLLHRLPLFDTADVSEILDIRTELNPYLRKFRGAIQTYSEEIQSDVWDEEFIHDTEKVFLKYVEPAVQEIEDVVKQTKTLSTFFEKVNVPSLLGSILTTAGNLPIMAMSTIGHSANAELERRNNNNAKQSQLFFYYRAGNLLDD